MKVLQAIHFPLEGAGAGVYTNTVSQALQSSGNQIQAVCADHYRPKTTYPTLPVIFSNGSNNNFDVPFDIPVFYSHPLSDGPTFGQLTNNQLTCYTLAFTTKVTQLSE